MFIVQTHARKKAEFEQKIFALQAEQAQNVSALKNELDGIYSERDRLNAKYYKLKANIERSEHKYNPIERIEFLITLSNLYNMPIEKASKKKSQLN